MNCRECITRTVFVTTSDGDEVCTGCGLVRHARLIDYSEEHVNYADSGENRHRTAAAAAHVECGMGTALPVRRQGGAGWVACRRGAESELDVHVQRGCSALDRLTGRMLLPPRVKV